jgi:hypothetical protein
MAHIVRDGRLPGLLLELALQFGQFAGLLEVVLAAAQIGDDPVPQVPDRVGQVLEDVAAEDEIKASVVAGQVRGVADDVVVPQLGPDRILAAAIVQGVPFFRVHLFEIAGLDVVGRQDLRLRARTDLDARALGRRDEVAARQGPMDGEEQRAGGLGEPAGTWARATISSDPERWNDTSRPSPCSGASTNQPQASGQDFSVWCLRAFGTVIDDPAGMVMPRQAAP